MNAFLGKKGMLMNKKQLVSTGIILALLGSNVVLGEKYIIDKHNLEERVYSQYELIEQNKVDMEFLTDAITTKLSENDDLLNRINIMNQQLNKVKKENAALKKENSKIKKQSNERKEANKHREFYVEATSFGHDCEGCSGFTYTQYDVRNTIYYNGMRIIATDNSVIPLYSIVRVDAKNESFTAIVLDRGGGIRGFEIDLLAESEKESLEFGRQKVLLTVLREGKG